MTADTVDVAVQPTNQTWLFEGEELEADWLLVNVDMWMLSVVNLIVYILYVH